MIQPVVALDEELWISCAGDAELRVNCFMGSVNSEVAETCSTTFILSLMVGFVVIAGIFTYLFVNTENEFAYLFLALIFVFMLIGLQALNLVAGDSLCTGWVQFNILYEVVFVILITSIVLIVFYIIYKIVFVKWLDRLSGREEDRELGWKDED